MSVTGAQIVSKAMTQSGKRYVFGVENDNRAFDATDAWDCSELVQIVCRDLGVRPVMPDGAYWQWRHCRNNGTMITVDRARRIAGALLFGGDGVGTGRDAIWHVAISRGDDTTIEARNTRYGTGSWPIGTRFQFAALIPGVDHAGTPPPYVPPVTRPPATTPPIVAPPTISTEEDDVAALLVSDGNQVWLTDGISRRAVPFSADRFNELVFVGQAKNTRNAEGHIDVPTLPDYLADIPIAGTAPASAPVSLAGQSFTAVFQ